MDKEIGVTVGSENRTDDITKRAARIREVLEHWRSALMDLRRADPIAATQFLLRGLNELDTNFRPDRLVARERERVEELLERVKALQYAIDSLRLDSTPPDS